MTDKNPWPLPAFHFRLTMDDAELRALDVDGLEALHSPVEHRQDGGSPTRPVRPLSVQNCTIALRHIIVPSGHPILKWFDAMHAGQAGTKTLTLAMLDRNDEVVRSWTLKNAFPVSLKTGAFDAMNNRVAVEELTFACDPLAQ